MLKYSVKCHKSWPGLRLPGSSLGSWRLHKQSKKLCNMRKRLGHTRRLCICSHLTYIVNIVGKKTLVSRSIKVQNTQNMKIVSMNCKDNNEFFSQLVFRSAASDSRSIKCTFLAARCLWCVVCYLLFVFVSTQS